jgi:hypothetical protein
VISSRSTRLRQQPWLAVAAAYLVALQLILTGFATGHLATFDDPASGNVSVTCLGHVIGADGGPGDTGQKPADQAPCVFCTLTAGSCAVAAVTPTVSFHATVVVARLVGPGDDQVVERPSPTGRYQRGPPAAAFIAV